jgi:HEPN domain-containing protein
MAEQATQLYIKAIILETGGEHPRTHSIRELIAMIGFLTN